MKTKNYILLTFLFVLIAKISDAQTGFVTHNLPTGYNNLQLRLKNCIATDASNNVYIGFRLIGVGKYTPSTQSWTMYDITNSGIPSNDVRAIEFDATGTMWVGTATKGLAKFDGSNWTTYTAIANGLVSDTIICLKAGSNGIWCGTRNGLSFFNGSTFTNYTNSNSPLVNNFISCLDVDSSNAVLIGNNSLLKFDGSNWTNYTTTTTGQPVNGIKQIKYVSSNATWLLTDLGLFKLSNGNIFYDAAPCNRTTVNQYYAAGFAIQKKNDNKIYSYGTQYDLFRIDQNDNIEYLTDSLSGNIFSSLTVRLYMVFDSNGLLWFTNDDASSTQYFYSFDESASVGFVNVFNTDYSGQRYLDINNVSALISNRGAMFWDMVQGLGNPKYEVPKCSGKYSAFTSSLWLGGYDASGLLHVSAQTYNQNNRYDFMPGPLDTTNAATSPSTVTAFDNIWKIDRNTIDDFKTNFLNGNVSNGTYPVPNELLTYPAVGTGNFTRSMSPYVDYNNDGSYDPYDGDYPLIKGDQQLYWIFNDTDTSNRESGGIPLGVEVRAYAYAYTCGQNALGDSNAVLDYTTFYCYEITNRSSNTYDSVFAGLFSDIDLGNAADDYNGCDTVLNAAFCYNAFNTDGGAFGYGTNPPMFNCQILQGPEPVLNDGIDNDHDGSIDEVGEVNMMSVFHPYENNFTISGNPVVADDYYDYLTSKFKDGSQTTYGNNGIGGTVPTNYFYSGLPYSSTGWNEMTTGNFGGDRRLVQSSGPFRLAPGETKTIDFAYVFTWDSTAANGLTTSIARNTADLQRVKYWFDNNNYPSCLNTSVQSIEAKNTDVTIFPNPTDDYLNVVYSGATKARIEVYDITGRYITAKEIKSRDKINIRSLSQGLYVAKVLIGNDIVSKKFIRK